MESAEYVAELCVEIALNIAILVEQRYAQNIRGNGAIKYSVSVAIDSPNGRRF